MEQSQNITYCPCTAVQQESKPNSVKPHVWHLGILQGPKLILPLKNTTFLNFLGNMGYMSVKDENFPRLLGVLRGK